MNVSGKNYNAAKLDQPVGYEFRPGKAPKRLSESRPRRALRHVSVRAGIVVTGTEVLGGLIADANGPWLSEQLRAHGVDAVAHGRGRRPAGGSAARRWTSSATWTW